jgi:hypothetical protein
MRNINLKAGDRIEITKGISSIKTRVVALGAAAIEISDYVNGSHYIWNSDEDHQPWIETNDTWHVELIKEEKMDNAVKEEKITRYSDLNVGDKLRISREIVVRSINSWDGIQTADNRKVRIAAAESGDLKKTGFEIVRLVPAKVHPDHYPAQKGDVWQIGTHEYYVHTGTYSSLSVRSSGGNSYNTDLIDNTPDAKLVHRIGNKF